MIQPIRAVTASSNSMPNIQKLSDNTFEVAIGNSTLIMENQPNNCFNATLITANGNTTTFETVLRAVTNQTALPNGANSTPAIMQKVLLVNGEVAGNLPINNQGMPQPTPQSAGNIKNPMPLASTTYYWWDGVLFAQGDGYNYPHPERSAYGISSSIDWVYSGNQLYHYQMDNTLSETIAYGTSEAFGEFVGTLIATGGLETLQATLSAPWLLFLFRDSSMTGNQAGFSMKQVVYGGGLASRLQTGLIQMNGLFCLNLPLIQHGLQQICFQYFTLWGTSEQVQ